MVGFMRVIMRVTMRVTMRVAVTMIVPMTVPMTVPMPVMVMSASCVHPPEIDRQPDGRHEQQLPRFHFGWIEPMRQLGLARR